MLIQVADQYSYCYEFVKLDHYLSCANDLKNNDLLNVRQIYTAKFWHSAFLFSLRTIVLNTQNILLLWFRDIHCESVSASQLLQWIIQTMTVSEWLFSPTATIQSFMVLMMSLVWTALSRQSKIVLPWSASQRSSYFRYWIALSVKEGVNRNLTMTSLLIINLYVTVHDRCTVTREHYNVKLFTIYQINTVAKTTKITVNTSICVLNRKNVDNFLWITVYHWTVFRKVVQVLGLSAKASSVCCYLDI